MRGATVPQGQYRWQHGSLWAGHAFECYLYYMWSARKTERRLVDCTVSHAYGSIIDTHRPSNQELLMSELLLAICLAKAQILDRSWFIDHEIIPVCFIVNIPR